MTDLYYFLLEKIYKFFYFYCISGQNEDRELLMNEEENVLKTGDNILIYFFQMMQYADGMDRDRNWDNFLSKKEEFAELLDNDFDTWCYHHVLFLIYTYIYPDAGKSAEHSKLSSSFKEQLSDKDVQMADRLIFFDREDYEIQKHLDNDVTMMEAYKTRFAERDFRMQKRSFLMILKGFSSSTPFFYPALENRFYSSPIKGGGIFIKWHGYGIAVDPGINFMENMHLNGLGIRDINAVIVTHDHIDHNGDLQVIDDLSYAMGQKIKIYVDCDTYKRSEQFSSMSDRHLLDAENRSGYILGEDQEIHMSYISTCHILDPEKKEAYKRNCSFALKISLKNESNGDVIRRIGITSDTEYFRELSDFLKDCDYIIANMSEPEKDDYMKSIIKKKHLGYYGCLRLIQDCNDGCEVSLCPRYIISEFWAGKGDARRELIKKLREKTEYTRIYPGDIGMLFFLDRSSFLCDYCGCETDMDKLHLLRDKSEYGRISLICDNCLLI